jgi:hypothetical protein
VTPAAKRAECAGSDGYVWQPATDHTVAGWVPPYGANSALRKLGDNQLVGALREELGGRAFNVMLTIVNEITKEWRSITKRRTEAHTAGNTLRFAARRVG